jgi:nucleotide-binding universal stress UspA family protein
MGYRKILVTLDGSKLAEQALKQVIQIAEPGAQIHLLSIMAPDRVSEIAALASAAGQAFQPLDSQWPPLHGPDDPHASDARRSYLEQVSEWLQQAEYPVTVEVREGKAIIESILNVARGGYEAIVMATHGRTGIGRAVLGSITQGVLAQAPCPVLVISPLSAGDNNS